jgi:hypothetical protein
MEQEREQKGPKAIQFIRRQRTGEDDRVKNKDVSHQYTHTHIHIHTHTHTPPKTSPSKTNVWPENEKYVS